MAASPRKIISPLRRIRFLSGIPQRDIAKAIGRQPSWLSKAEDGTFPVSEREARILARIFKTSIKELFPGGGYKKYRSIPE